MIINDKQGTLIQILKEKFQEDSSTTQKRPKRNKLIEKKKA